MDDNIRPNFGAAYPGQSKQAGLENSPKYSSLLNLFRHKSKRSESKPNLHRNPESKISQSFLNKQSLLDLYKGLSNKSNMVGRNSKLSTDNQILDQKQQSNLLRSLCQIEAQTEYLSGTLICEVLGFTGFVKLLPKDSPIRIIFKYGSPELENIYQFVDGHFELMKLHKSDIPMKQLSNLDDKWLTNGRLVTTLLKSFNFTPVGHDDLKFADQRWDQTQHIFSPTIGGVLTIKVSNQYTFYFKTYICM